MARSRVVTDWLRWRRKHGLRQSDMARVLGCCTRSIHNVERGKTKPIARTRLRFRELQKRYAREAEWQQLQSK